VDFDAMLTDIKAIPAGDIVLLHGCCHNPTGANLSEEQEDQIIAALAANGAIPFVDIAYQGFGDGLEGDARFTRKIASQLPECLIAASCSKNFGIYRERTGILMAISPNAALKAVTQGNMAFLNRQNFSFPPDHGARLVTMILADTGLRSTWASELEDTRLSMLNLRQQLADELRQRTNSDRFDFIARHRGMFSLLGVSPEVVETMRADNGVYMVGDSRINIAGLNAHTVPVLAQALAAALK
jgi:aromatic-amino-acid transaminase